MTQITGGVIIHLQGIGVRHWKTTQGNGKHSKSNNSKTVVRRRMKEPSWTVTGRLGG